MSRPGRSRSTPTRLLIAILGITLIGFIVAGTATFASQRARVVDAVDARLNDQVDALSAVLAPQRVLALPDSAAVPAPQTPPKQFTTVGEALTEVLAHLSPGANESAFAIVAGVPSLRASGTSSLGLVDDQATIEAIVSGILAENEPLLGTAHTRTGEVRYIAIPVHVEGSSEVGIYVHAVNLDALLAAAAGSIAAYSITALVCLIGVGVAVWFFIARIYAPLKDLQQTTNQISASGLHSRVAIEGSDEIQDIGRSVNEMLDRVETSVEAQRQLLDDVRHELKTPITIVRGYLEMMNAGDPSDVKAARDIGISELDRMTRLVEDIDTLATVEVDEYTMGVVDIGSLTERVGDLVSVIPGHTWLITSVADGIVRGNADRVLQAWLALADNAAKYTPEGSPIEIGSARTPSSMMMWVRDRGPGIPPAARHRIFRRFDRGSSKRDVGGSGLGLAIVDAIARAHGGSCSVSETPGGGATFTIHVPLRLGGAASALPAPVRAGDVVQQWEER